MFKKLVPLLFLIVLIYPCLASAESSWEEVETLSSNPISDTSVAVDSQGAMYIAYIEYDSDMYISVDKYEDEVLTSLDDINLGGGYDYLTLALDASDIPYIVFYSTEYGVMVQKYVSGAWMNVGNISSLGIATLDESPVHVHFFIAPDDTIYLAYEDDASLANPTSKPSILFYEYTGNVTTDIDGNPNDGWEYALAPFYTGIGNFQFDVDEGGEIYLVINIDRSADISGATSVVYMTYAYRYQNGWTSILGDPYYPAIDEFYMKPNQDGFDLYAYDNEVTIDRYTRSTNSWEVIADEAVLSETEFIAPDYNSSTYFNYTYTDSGTQFATDSSNNLFFVYGNTDSSVQDQYNPWGSATVAVYNGSDWDYLGSPRFSEISSMYFSIALADEEYYVICRDGQDGYAVLYKYIIEESSAEGTTAETTGMYGTSPATGETEEISKVSGGQYIRSSSFNTIYYIDTDGSRRPFWNSDSFFTYTDSFNDMVWVTDATLPTMEMGVPMLHKPGSVLVKIQSDPRVYAIDEGNVLRWVPDEYTASQLYGSNWSDYVVDVDATSFARFSVSDDMTGNELIDKTIMKTRQQLSASK